MAWCPFWGGGFTKLGLPIFMCFLIFTPIFYSSFFDMFGMNRTKSSLVILKTVFKKFVLFPLQQKKARVSCFFWKKGLCCIFFSVFSKFVFDCFEIACWILCLRGCFFWMYEVFCAHKHVMASWFGCKFSYPLYPQVAHWIRPSSFCLYMISKTYTTLQFLNGSKCFVCNRIEPWNRTLFENPGA